MNNTQWQYHNPVFECEKYNPVILDRSPWAGHRAFAYDYICDQKPQTIVELGSYYGCSAFAFLQAIKDHAPECEFYAVDTWEGDSFTKNDYKEDIYGAYREINDACFSGLHSHMLRMTFDQACQKFADASIDLLHIDGSHRYEDVKDDYETWKSKVKPDGVIFFHDVGMDLLFGEPMGSHIFWEELKQQMPYTLEFPFSNGLGMLFWSEKVYRRIRDDVSFDRYQQAVNLQDTINKDRIRKDFFTIRDLRIQNEDLNKQIPVLNYHLDRYREDTKARVAYISELESRVKTLGDTVAQQSADLAAKDSTICSSQRQLEELCTYTSEKEAYLTDLEDQMKQLNAFLQQKEQYITSLESDLAESKQFADQKENYIGELVSEKEKLQKFADEKSDYAVQLEAELSRMKDFTDSKQAYLTGLEAQMEQLREFSEKKEQYAADLELQMQKLDSYSREKEQYGTQLEQQLSELAAFADQKEAYIQDLETQKQQLTAFVQEKSDYAQSLEQAQSQLQHYCEAKEAYIADLENQKEDLQKFAQDKERYAAQLQSQLTELNHFASEKTEYARQLEAQMADLNRFASEKCAYIETLETQQTRLNEACSAMQLQLKEAGETVSRLQTSLDRSNRKCSEAEMREAELRLLLSNTHRAIEALPFGTRILNRVNRSVECKVTENIERGKHSDEC